MPVPAAAIQVSGRLCTGATAPNGTSRRASWCAVGPGVVAIVAVFAVVAVVAQFEEPSAEDVDVHVPAVEPAAALGEFVRSLHDERRRRCR